MDNINDRHR